MSCVAVIVLLGFAAQAHAIGVSLDDTTLGKPATTAKGLRYHRSLTPIHRTAYDTKIPKPLIQNNPISYGAVITTPSTNRITRSMAIRAAMPIENTLSDTVETLDALCNVDTGEGCGEDLKEEVTVDVDLGEGMKPLPAVFEVSAPGNTIHSILTGLPSGIVFEENDERHIVVAEIDEAAAGYKCGVRLGDILRATTCVVKQKRVDANAFGVYNMGSSGQKALFNVDGASFAKAMSEIRSNANLDDAVTLVVERPKA